MTLYRIESVSTLKGTTMRVFLVDGEDEADAVSYFRDMLPYRNPRLRVFIAEDGAQPDIIIDQRIGEIWPSAPRA